MKHKRLLTWILAAVMVLLALSICACGDKPQVQTLENLKLPKLENNEMVIVEKVGDEEYKYFTIPLVGDLSEKSSLLDVLEYVRDEFGVTLDVAYGFINKFDKLPHEGVANEYVYLYTSVAADFDTSAYVEEFDCDGVTVKTSAVGAADMHVKVGCVIYIATIVYNG